MSSSRGGYQPQACNLCWKELQAPFLVTSCNHLFCLSHRDHEAFQQQSCPGCGHHLSESKGLKQANYDVKSSDLPVLNGVTPDAALKVAGTAIKFWVQQERTQLNYMQHAAQRAAASKDEQRERFEEAYSQAKNETSNAVADKEQAQLQNEELARENQTLHQKLQTQGHKVRALEETVVKLKRGTPDSPSRGPSPGRAMGEQPATALPDAGRPKPDVLAAPGRFGFKPPVAAAKLYQPALATRRCLSRRCLSPPPVALPAPAPAPLVTRALAARRYVESKACMAGQRGSTG